MPAERGAGPDVDGGRRAWLTVAAAFTVLAVAFGALYSFGVVATPMADEFDAGSTAMSSVFSVTMLIAFGLGSVSGMVADRLGPRTVLLAGGLAFGAGLALTAAAPTLPLALLTYGVGVGIGAACALVPMLALVTSLFTRWRTAATGFAVAGIGVGTFVVAPLAARAITLVGWRATYLGLGVIGAAVFAAGAFVVARPVSAAATELPLQTVARVARDAGYRRHYLSVFLLSGAVFIPYVHLPPAALALGLDQREAAALVAAIGGASVAGRLLLGPAGARFGIAPLYRGAFSMLPAAYLFWVLSPTPATLMAFAVLLGAGYGGYVALNPGMMADEFGLDGLGGTLGLLYTAGGLGAALGPIAAGALVDVTGGYRAGSLLGLAFACAAWLSLPRRRRATGTHLGGAL